MSAKILHASNRLVPLEAYRGIAAFIVLVHHFFLAFSPYTMGILPTVRNTESLIGQPYFALFNGTGAVGFFFTLSGFVLCWSYFHHEDRQKLLLAFLKRFPRLVAIVTLTTIASYCLFKLNLYYFREASDLSSSPWLAAFAFGLTPDFEPNFLKALTQGVTTFFTGAANYNTNLWTMKPEFFGSMIVYMLACFISVILGYRHLIYALAIISISAFFYNDLIFPFVVGAFLSAYLAKSKTEVSFLTSIGLIILGLYFLGYMLPEKAYIGFSIIPQSVMEHSQTLFHTLGSACIIFATMSNKTLFNSLNGRFFASIGKISFPLYLVHTLIICSLSSYAYVKFMSHGFNNTTSLVIVFTVTAVTSIALAVPLSKFDDWWVKRVDSGVQGLLGKNDELRP